MTNGPLITVLMAVHDAEGTVATTIESVLSQDCADLEFVIVDDASGDGSPALLQAAAARDRRVRLFRNPANLGLTASLNIGLGAATGKFIARIDADDLCRPGRLSRQLAAMQARPDLVLIGGGYRIIDTAGRGLGTVSGPLCPAQARWMLGFSPPSFHPTYFFRRIGPDGALVRYDPDFSTAQDYDLWARMAALGPTLTLPDALIDYRRHAGGISVTRQAEQAATAARVSARVLAARMTPAALARIAPLTELLRRRGSATGAGIDAAVAAAEALLAHDLPQFPKGRDRRWLKRTVAALLADAVLSRGGAVRRPRDLARFAWRARGFLPHLVAAVAARPATARKALAAALPRRG